MMRLGLLAMLVAALPVNAQFVEEDVSALRVLMGEENGDWFGWVCASVGDLDGDGAEELLIPAIGYQGFAGRATLYSGASGIVLNDIVGAPGEARGFSVGAAGDVDADGTLDYIVGGARVEVYSGADHSLLLDLTAATGFGHGVAAAGDVDGDGHGDLVVGSQRTAATFVDAGRVLLLSGADGSTLWSRDGTAEAQFLGSAVGGLGDVNGDGTPDVVAGAFGAGEAYVLDGSDGEIVHTLLPIDPLEARVFGQFFASGTPDFDGDGVGDVFVADYDAGSSATAFGTGYAYVFSGRTGERIHAIGGLEPGGGFGPGRGVADLNGDGVPDLIVGAYTANAGAPFAGATYVISGRSGALLRRITATVANDNFGVDAISPGDVDGDGLPDLLVTALGLSFAGLDVGRAFLIAGTELPCPADLNGNGRVGPIDLVRLLFAIRLGDASADLNGDGVLDGADVHVLLRDLGRCAPGRPK